MAIAWFPCPMMPAKPLVIVMVLGGVVFSGCNDDAERLRPIVNAMFPRPIKPKRGERVNYVARVRLRMESFQVPASRPGEADVIWRRLTDGMLDYQTRRALALNGIRVGVASRETWKDFLKTLDGRNGRNLGSTLETLYSANESVAIALDRFHDRKALFVFNPDATLAGADHQPGHNELGARCVLTSQQPVRIAMTLTPQIRSIGRHLTYRKGPKRFTTVRPEKVHSFLPLALHLTLSDKEFLVLGPGPEARDETSAGSHFFVRRRDGIRHETLLVIAPEVFYMTAPTSPGQPGKTAPPPPTTGPPRPPAAGRTTGAVPGAGRRVIRVRPPKNGKPRQADEK